ncbi:MAG: hypothetical protein ACN4GW_10545 [Desulforhopalus sp.]
MQNPLLYQFKVRPTTANEFKDSLSGAIATVMVFADSDEVGRCRSGRFIARNHWEIEEFMRVMAVCPQRLELFDAAFRKVYRKAEHFGIAACFDGWKKHTHK